MKLQIAKEINDIVGYVHWCPGCNEFHFIPTEDASPITGETWKFNGDMEYPTFTPDVFIARTGTMREFHYFYTTRRGSGPLCHYEIKDGKIDYRRDSEHHLSGQIVDMADVGKKEPEQKVTRRNSPKAYPKAKYHYSFFETDKGCVVHSAQEEAALGEGWYDSPTLIPKKEEAKAEDVPQESEAPPEPPPAEPVEQSEQSAEQSPPEPEAPPAEPPPTEEAPEALPEPPPIEPEIPRPASPVSKCPCGSNRRYYLCHGAKKQ